MRFFVEVMFLLRLGTLTSAPYTRSFFCCEFPGYVHVYDRHQGYTQCVSDFVDH